MILVCLCALDVILVSLCALPISICPDKLIVYFLLQEQALYQSCWMGDLRETGPFLWVYPVQSPSPVLEWNQSLLRKVVSQGNVPPGKPHSLYNVE